MISPTSIDDAFIKSLPSVLDAGDIACFQLRLKNLPDDTICRIAEAIRPSIQGCGIAFLLNDRPDLAIKTGCDGVHIGQNDADYSSARAAVGTGRIVGVTCHNSRHLALEAAEKGADYVAFGAFYPSNTKETDYRADCELLSWWQEMITVPCVAIGGINLDNATPLIAAGADFLAVSSSVWNHPEGAKTAIAGFNRLMSVAK